MQATAHLLDQHVAVIVVVRRFRGATSSCVPFSTLHHLVSFLGSLVAPSAKDLLLLLVLATTGSTAEGVLKVLE